MERKDWPRKIKRNCRGGRGGEGGEVIRSPVAAALSTITSVCLVFRRVDTASYGHGG